MMSDIIKQAFDFGSKRSEHNFFSFTLKILIYIIPAVILGNYTDVIVTNLKKDKLVGENTLYYIILQTCIIMITLYFIEVYLPNFLSEFQVTIAGGYFTVLYFGIQTNYIDMIQKYMN